MYTYRVYLVRRLAGSVLIAFAVSAIIFLLMQVTPRSPQAAIVSQSKAVGQKIQQGAGPDASFYLQYLQWITELVTGHLGKTFWRHDNIADLIWRRGPLSAEIVILAVLMSWLVGLPLGIISALYPASAIDIRVRRMSELCLAIPGFWLAMLIVLGLRLWFHQIALWSRSIWCPT